ncbi:MAG: xanthine dehydrogenase family protein molybdopterin-binding subunit [Gemmatimonadaceae bacterium]|nr:xanthine dehydrogenase family protein molybdopterin-binding subunit [Gemmatimonadaceae bacterium]
MKRRTFLLAGAGAGGALLMGWALLPPRQRLIGRHPPTTTNGAIALNGWVTIAPDDTVTVVVPKAEMGQGIHTALAMVLAEELGCEWTRVRVEFSPIDAIYANIVAAVEGLPFHPDATGPLVRGVKWISTKLMREFGIMATGSSSSVRDCWMPMREAGASARAALVATAAERWGVAPAACRVEAGVVVHGEQRLRFGQLVADAVRHRPSQIVLKAMSDFALLGTATPRLDTADKTRGALTYGIDVRVPSMCYAAVAMPSALGSTLVSHNSQAALAMDGVRAVVPVAGSRYGDPPAIAIIADTWWQAQRALPALAPVWSASPHAALTSRDVRAQLRQHSTQSNGLPIRVVRDVGEGFASAATVLEATYDAPYLAHAAMEPLNATVRVQADRAELWVGTQVPDAARRAVAHAAGIADDAVAVHQHPIGSSFGRRLDVDFIAQAAAIAAARPGVAVQTIWSRENDMQHDMYRPAAAAHLRAGIAADGTMSALTIHAAGQAPFAAVMKRAGIPLLDRTPDRTIAEGTWDQPYEFAALRATQSRVHLPVPVGLWRSVGHSHQAFFLESFLDEIAVATKRDPVELRRGLLAHHERARRVLELAAERSGWGTSLAVRDDGQPCARGIALHESYGSIVAQVAEVSLSAERRTRVHRVVAAVDCGFVLNPNIVKQQIEGAVVMGLAAALSGEITFEQGRVQQSNFHDYPVLRFSECPIIETHLVPSLDEPKGIGEPGLPPIAPAVANALFALTGERLRSLPLRLTEQQ